MSCYRTIEKLFPDLELNQQLQILEDFKIWAKDNLGQGYSLEMEEDRFIDRVTAWTFNGFCAGRKAVSDLKAA